MISLPTPPPTHTHCQTPLVSISVNILHNHKVSTKKTRTYVCTTKQIYNRSHYFNIQNLVKGLRKVTTEVKENATKCRKCRVLLPLPCFFGTPSFISIDAIAGVRCACALLGLKISTLTFYCQIWMNVTSHTITPA